MTARQPNLLIPVNHLIKTKGRLQNFLDEKERAQLTLKTLQTAITAGIDAGFTPAILTADEDIESLITNDINVFGEQKSLTGLNDQINYVISKMARTELLIVHADLPLITAKSLHQLKKASLRTNSVVIAKSFDGGTNAIFLRSPKKFVAKYGPQSCAQHCISANIAGLPATIITPPELYLDLDTPKDLRKLLSTVTGRKSLAGKYLSKIGVVERLKQFKFPDVNQEDRQIFK